MKDLTQDLVALSDQFLSKPTIHHFLIPDIIKPTTMDQKINEMVRVAKARYLADASIAYDKAVAPYLALIQNMSNTKKGRKKS